MCIIRFKIQLLLALAGVLFTAVSVFAQPDKNLKFAPCSEPKQFYRSAKELPKNATRVKILKRSEPEYTGEARVNGIRGRVVLEATFSCEGTITDISVVEGLPDGLTDASIAVTEKIKFRPALVDGKSVSVRLRVEYEFRLI